MLRNGLLLSLLALLAGCAVTTPDTHDADVKALKDTEAAWAKDIASKDIDKCMQYYGDGAILLTPNEPMIAGKEPIKAAFKQLLADPNFSLTFASTNVDVSKSGDLGYTVGTYSLTMTDPKTKQPMTDKGKYTTVFRKQADGSWKAVADMDSSDLPSEAPSSK